jgi:hypothetical protein
MSDGQASLGTAELKSTRLLGTRKAALLTAEYGFFLLLPGIPGAVLLRHEKVPVGICNCR